MNPKKEILKHCYCNINTIQKSVFACCLYCKIEFLRFDVQAKYEFYEQLKVDWNFISLGDGSILCPICENVTIIGNHSISWSRPNIDQWHDIIF